MQVEAVFFDLDGVLADSRQAFAHCINHALAQTGLPMQEEARLHRLNGPPLHGTFVRLLGEIGADPSLAEECVLHYREVYSAVSLERTYPVPGMAELLEEIAGRATVMVVTSKPAEFAVPLVEMLGYAAWTQRVFAPSLDALHEEKSASLVRALEAASIPVSPQPPHRAWMVGDREHDVIAGKACGIATAGVAWGIGDRAELEAAAPDVIVDTTGEL
ncbi:MAG: HAD family hydrolase [Chloroflexota bacterium]